jgi:hypothetical protein
VEAFSPRSTGRAMLLSTDTRGGVQGSLALPWCVSLVSLAATPLAGMNVIAKRESCIHTTASAGSDTISQLANAPQIAPNRL